MNIPPRHVLKLQAAAAADGLAVAAWMRQVVLRELRRIERQRKKDEAG